MKMEKKMKTPMKMWLAATALLVGLAGQASAIDTDSLTVTITPTASYSLTVSTNPGSGDWLNLGTVGLGLSTFTVRPATVTVTSSYAQTDLTIIGTVLSGGWTLGANSAALGNDELAAWAVFTDTSVMASPAQASGYFSGTTPNVDNTDLLRNAIDDVGTAAGGNRKFVAAAGDAGYRSMEDISSNAVDAPAATSHLWLRFKLPPTTTTLTAKQLQITITAGIPN
ncbi:MAG: hypothetical protein ABL955_07300 [Elusimicrobiota bacterium]